MSKKPPIPPKQRSSKAPDDPKNVKRQVPDRVPPENLDQQGQSGNLRQNTRNQGYQQDR